MKFQVTHAYFDADLIDTARAAAAALSAALDSYEAARGAESMDQAALALDEPLRDYGPLCLGCLDAEDAAKCAAVETFLVPFAERTEDRTKIIGNLPAIHTLRTERTTIEDALKAHGKGLGAAKAMLRTFRAIAELAAV